MVYTIRSRTCGVFTDAASILEQLEHLHPTEIRRKREGIHTLDAMVEYVVSL